MRFRSSSTQRTSPTFLPCILAFFAAVRPSAACALQQLSPPQSPPAQSQSASIYTLHVYANLMEVPTLVLSSHLAPVPRISPDSFEISLDGGPLFHPTQLQLEHNQPISLAILFDLNGSAHSLQSALLRTIPNFAAHALRASDRLSLYAVEGSCISSAKDLPPTSPDRIAPAFDQILHPPHPHGATPQHLQCGKSPKLWNAIATVSQSIKSQPSHRIILVISDGQDHNSSLHWQAVREFCASYSIAIFGLSPIGRKAPDRAIWMKLQDDPFSSLAQLTGGLVLYTTPDRVEQQLNHFLELVRGRYILDFPSPDNSSPGVHSIEVKVDDTDDFVRPAGIAFAPPDRSLLTAPDAVPGPPSPAILGDKPTINPPH